MAMQTGPEKVVIDCDTLVFLLLELTLTCVEMLTLFLCEAPLLALSPSDRLQKGQTPAQLTPNTTRKRFTPLNKDAKTDKVS